MDEKRWTAVKIIFDYHDTRLGIEIIADIFYDAGISGLVIDDLHKEPMCDWENGAFNPPEKPSVTGYIPKNNDGRKILESIKKNLAIICENHGISYEIILETLDEEDWAESWKEYFFVEKITDKIVVKPSWRKYMAKDGDIVIEIDPGMAFGTGTHPTTSLCISMLESFVKPNDYVLDVGTGSGILMIAAIKLGAEKVLGVDQDQVAVEVAIKNLLMNGIGPGKSKVIQGNLVESSRGKFSIVVANILTHVILELLDNIMPVMEKDGIFIASGITIENRDKVACKMKKIGLAVISIKEKDGWVAIAGKNHKLCP